MILISLRKETEMIKHFCDRCGKECDEPRIIRVPYTKELRYCGDKEREVCIECENKFWQVSKKLEEIRLVFFRDFMNTGESLEEKHKNGG